MLREMGHQLIPGFEAPGGRNILLVPEGVKRVRIKGQLLRHEADLDHRANTLFQQTIVDLIDIRKIVDRVAVLILVIDPDFVMQDGMKAHVLKIRYLLYRAQVVAIAIAQGQDRAAGAKHLLPEMGEGCSRRRGVNLNLLLGKQRTTGRKRDTQTQHNGR